MNIFKRILVNLINFIIVTPIEATTILLLDSRIKPNINVSVHVFSWLIACLCYTIFAIMYFNFYVFLAIWAYLGLFHWMQIAHHYGNLKNSCFQLNGSNLNNSWKNISSSWKEMHTDEQLRALRKTTFLKRILF